jgi:DUF4097 and DUF4098 domain-containing protein YvlB
MKTLLALLLAFSACIPALADSYAASEKFAQTYPISSQGELRLENINGSIEIIAWDNNEISLEAEKRANTTEDLQKIVIKIESTPDRLSVKTEYAHTGWFGSSVKGEVRYTLKVPANLKLEKIRSVNSSIVIQNVTGPVNASTVNGGIQANGLGAWTNLETVNGNISCRFDEIAPDQSIRAKTVNGSCKLIVPTKAAISIQAETVNGHVSCSLPITLEKSSRTKIYGRTGPGKVATIEAKTVNGNISLATD